MRKALLVMGVLLVALSVMAPGPPEKAEKLKFDDNTWDSETSQFTVDMSCQFGIATAASAPTPLATMSSVVSPRFSAAAVSTL